MPFLPDGMGIARLQFALTGDPENMMITLGYRCLVGSDQAAHQGAVSGLEADFFQHIVVGAASIHTSYRYLGAEATGQTASGPIPIVAPRSVQGTNVGAPPPQNCATLVKKLTAGSGQRNRGRCFVPPFDLGEGNVSASGVIDAAAVTAIQAKWTAFLADAQTGVANYELMLLHSTAAMGDAREITSLTVDSVIASQRQRLRR